MLLESTGELKIKHATRAGLYVGV